MSTSLLYHAFGTTTYTYQKTEYSDGVITFHIKKKRDKQRCARCRSKDLIRQGGRNYLIQTIPIGGKPVWLNTHLKRLECKACGHLGQETRDFADDRKSYSRHLQRLVIDLAEVMTIQDVANHLNLKWHLVRDIVAEQLKHREKQRSWRHVESIAIDEIAVRKGHSYMTVVVDLKSGMVLDAVDGRKAESLEPVFKRLRRAGAKLKAVAMDMSPAYLKAVKSYWPDEVAIVHDPFHIVQSVNKAVDQVRRMEQERLDASERRYIKGGRFLLLKGWEKLEPDADKVERLETMLFENKNLYQAYLLKEDLRQLWQQESKGTARQFLNNWIEEACSSKLRPFQTLAKTLRERQEEILAWYDYPISTGPLEGLNNKIKVLKRRAYGYRNQAFFRLRILFIHETAFKLSGT